ncbi:MAG: hypothetical protein PHC51_05470 [bacterium]|nr:hypothetical protein [bacterium]
MIVPQFWAEEIIKQRIKGKQITVRRFGWSDISQEDAQRNAETRVREAFEKVVSGQRILRREPRVSYNGAEGVPIREEIVRRSGDTVITRNIYGALCLNTPDVLFVDVDFDKSSKKPLLVGAAIGASGAILMLTILFGKMPNWPLGIMVIGALLGAATASMFKQLPVMLAGGAEQLVCKRAKKYVRQYPQWSLRLYRTPAGIRILVMHETFSPADTEVELCFRYFGVDPIYARMCRNQQCFRARVTPKPWRINMSGHIKPRPGVWPVRPESLPGRKLWIADYEHKSGSFAACRFIGTVGNGPLHHTALSVQNLHDELSRAHSTLPIA